MRYEDAFDMVFSALPGVVRKHGFYESNDNLK